MHNTKFFFGCSYVVLTIIYNYLKVKHPTPAYLLLLPFYKKWLGHRTKKTLAFADAKFLKTSKKACLLETA